MLKAPQCAQIDIIAEYFRVIIGTLPAFKLPSNQLGVIGAYLYFDLKLKELRGYAPLRLDNNQY